MANSCTGLLSLSASALIVLLIVMEHLTRDSMASAMAVTKGNEETFEYFMFSQEWPYTFCTENEPSCNNTDKLVPIFNIHGLWPEKVKGDCQGEFNYSQLKPVESQLRKYWMDLLNPRGNPKDFWNHEYTKHGRCASVDSRFNSTLKYFQSALSIYLKYNVTQFLKSAGIVPGSTSYKASKIIEAVNSAFGYKPEIDCFAPGKKHGEKSKPAYLAELRICFSKDLTPRECESSGREVPQPRHSAHTLYYDPELPRSFHREAEANVYSPIKMSRSVKNLIASWIETERPTAVSERKRIWTSPCKDDEDVQLPEKLNY
ncbi:hypothetical protein BOX15_Mlig028581g1 [Macrostomum lignano]|uniref:Uncharacterized protein n=1 Tax=Macrostomum lignano TaxID=282301 RepID=A0A267G393_9PLAT|nr:hypothetical protein BOX15_Mlig028581g1 [Macrostomum lignano]